MKKYFTHFKLTLKEKRKILNTYKKGDVSCFFSPTISQVENYFSRYMGGGTAVAVTNCTSALYLAYSVLNIKSDEHIIMPNYTHPSTAFAAKTANVNMKFCDCCRNSYNVNIKHLKTLITSKTKAIVFVHLRGLKQNVEEVAKVCKEHKIVLIEDVAQGFGIKFKDKLAGSFGDISCFSFNDSKTVQLGEGGMCLFKNTELAERAKIILHEGEYSNTFFKSTTHSNGTVNDVIKRGFKYDEKGFNFRPFPPIFSILESRISKVEKMRVKKHRTRDIYNTFINKSKFNIMKSNQDDMPICYPVITKSKKQVECILSNAYNGGYPIGKMAYPTLNKIESLKSNCLNVNDNFAESEKLFERLIFLPLSTNITKREAKKLVNHLNELVKIDKIKEWSEDKEIKNFDGLYLW